MDPTTVARSTMTTAAASTALEDPGRAAMASPHVEHVRATIAALEASHAALAQADLWGRRLASVLGGGGRLLAAGNGGSAAEAQHLTAELVGRFRADRPPFSAIALHAETSSMSAILNDYGPDEVFARQAEAHGRPGDVLILLSTSGRSPNLLRAAERVRRRGVTTWAMTGPAPNPLADACDETAAVNGATTAAVQEVHLVAVHVLCAAFDEALAEVAS
jgi:D-sedoheptulose 7-phosphate isomerase